MATAILGCKMTRNKLTKLIEKSQETYPHESRDYIGASSIGSDCLRQIWYQYQGTESKDVPAKVRRTWAIGKVLEGLILDWLENAGLEIARTWFDLQSEGMPYFRGHVDSVWIKKDEAHAVIEIKTAKNSSFQIFAKKGVKEWNPQYYAQIQSYMGMMRVNSAYILVLNKDNSDISDELVMFDQAFYDGLRKKAALIHSATSAPPRIHGSNLYFKCKMCSYNKVCHK